MYVIRIQNGIMMCKKLDDWSSRKDDYMWTTSTCDCDCNKAYKIYECLDIENCSFGKCFFGKLALTCEDEY